MFHVEHTGKTFKVARDVHIIIVCSIFTPINSLTLTKEKKMAVTKKDKYINIAVGSVTMSAANTLTESEILTNLSIRAGLAWEIHFVDFQVSNSDLIAQNDHTNIVLSGKQGEAALPNLISDQYIAGYHLLVAFVTSGHSIIDVIKRVRFPKPMIFLKDKMSLYGFSAGQSGALTGLCRIGYTVTPVKAMTALEIAETWR